MNLKDESFDYDILLRQIIFISNCVNIYSEWTLEYPLPLKVTAIAVGAQFTLALGNCGIVWSWGINKYVAIELFQSVPFVRLVLD